MLFARNKKKGQRLTVSADVRWTAKSKKTQKSGLESTVSVRVPLTKTCVAVQSCAESRLLEGGISRGQNKPGLLGETGGKFEIEIFLYI